MSERKIIEFVNETLDEIRVMLMRRFGKSPREIEEIIKKSNIEKRMYTAPDVFMHLSDEQLLDAVKF